MSFKYDDNGYRTQKTVGSSTTDYYLEGDKVIYEKTGDNITYYTYDEKNKLISMNLSGTEYYYIRNAQNDIIGLFNSDGNQVVSYTYDSWGKLISTTGSLASTVGASNPYRYRGYRYDTETGLYYLNSRYYNPEWGRFINADATEALTATKGEVLGANLFAYCVNNPVNYSDPSGYYDVEYNWIDGNSLYETFKGISQTFSNKALWYGIIFGLGTILTSATVIVAGILFAAGALGVGFYSNMKDIYMNAADKCYSLYLAKINFMITYDDNGGGPINIRAI